ncbi:MAG: hypothetical protein DWI29_00505 [Planctomycetota bacterium]|nr:MAG: hypothetical protein DWI29_00505 [Planctomycetota bacterium]
MISEQTQSTAIRAKAIYAERLQAKLEAENHNKFVAIEPESGDYFVSDSFGQAVADARLVYPDRISFVIRVGHQVALHMGAVTK